METMRKKYSAEFKAQIVLDILKEEKSIAQLASEHDIHSGQLSRWRDEAIQNLPEIFTDKRNRHKYTLKTRRFCLYNKNMTKDGHSLNPGILVVV